MLYQLWIRESGKYESIGEIELHARPIAGDFVAFNEVWYTVVKAFFENTKVALHIVIYQGEMIRCPS